MMRSSENIRHVLSRKSFPDFLKAMNNKVDVKEWSEVGGVFNISRCVLRHFDPELIVDVGCGKRPTLATMMALNYNKRVYAIDPNVSKDYATDVQHLTLIKNHLSGVCCSHDVFSGRSVLLLANHSHSTQRDAIRFLANFESWVYMTVPCCVDNTLTQPGIVKRDIHVHSPKNKVYTYTSDKTLLEKLARVA